MTRHRAGAKRTTIPKWHGDRLFATAAMGTPAGGRAWRVDDGKSGSSSARRALPGPMGSSVSPRPARCRCTLRPHRGRHGQVIDRRFVTIPGNNILADKAIGEGDHSARPDARLNSVPRNRRRVLDRKARAWSRPAAAASARPPRGCRGRDGEPLTGHRSRPGRYQAQPGYSQVDREHHTPRRATPPAPRFEEPSRPVLLDEVRACRLSRLASPAVGPATGLADRTMIAMVRQQRTPEGKLEVGEWTHAGVHRGLRHEHVKASGQRQQRPGVRREHERSEQLRVERPSRRHGDDDRQEGGHRPLRDHALEERDSTLTRTGARRSLPASRQSCPATPSTRAARPALTRTATR